MRIATILGLLLAGVTEAATGGQFCSTRLCINAIVDTNVNKVYYQLQSTLGFSQIGWMAAGFGVQMTGSPMVITWPNADGSITLSQRMASSHSMPEVTSNPTEVAALAWQYSILRSNSTTIAFEYPIPANLNQVQMIYAYASIRPPSSSPDATLQQHDDSGTFTLDLSQPSLTALPTGAVITTVIGTQTTVIPASIPTESVSGGVNGGPSTALDDDDLPLTPGEKTMRTHGVLMAVGYLLLLPLGVFIARFSRTIPFLKNRWFNAHAFVQLILSAPVIITGFVVAYHHVGSKQEKHFRDTHTRIGLVLLILYLIQLCGGIFIHKFKPSPKPLTTTTTMGEKTRLPSDSSTSTITLPPRENAKEGIKGRPIQNYAHAIMGILIITLAFYNVRRGFTYEWQSVFGQRWSQTSFTRSINAFWIAWVVIIPCVYILGLTLLPRQWRQENEYRRNLSSSAPPQPQQNGETAAATTNTV